MSGSNPYTSTPTREQLLAVTNRYLTAFANDKNTHFTCWPSSPQLLQSPYSTIHPAPHIPKHLILRGPNAVRSYFDLIATHWTRSPVSHRIIDADPFTRTVIFEGSITWKWKKSGRSWIEDFTCTLAFDELLKIVSYVVRTDSASKTCLNARQGCGRFVLDENHEHQY
ncbi:hypothetical protein H2248_007034 [Termitomyces sp. 'cryptogamus']|nr:hypothetical protein H2248_007034 [Termitomyces sp. 'cryptogamus']